MLLLCLLDLRSCSSCCRRSNSMFLYLFYFSSCSNRHTCSNPLYLLYVLSFALLFQLVLLSLFVLIRCLPWTSWICLFIRVVLNVLFVLIRCISRISCVCSTFQAYLIVLCVYSRCLSCISCICSNVSSRPNCSNSLYFLRSLYLIYFPSCSHCYICVNSWYNVVPLVVVLVFELR